MELQWTCDKGQAGQRLPAIGAIDQRCASAPGMGVMVMHQVIDDQADSKNG